MYGPIEKKVLCVYGLDGPPDMHGLRLVQVTYLTADGKCLYRIEYHEPAEADQ